MFSLLKPTFSLPHRPQKLTFQLHPIQNAPLPIRVIFIFRSAFKKKSALPLGKGREKKLTNPIASAGCLVPAIVGARTLYQ